MPTSYKPDRTRQQRQAQAKCLARHRQQNLRLVQTPKRAQSEQKLRANQPANRQPPLPTCVRQDSRRKSVSELKSASKQMFPHVKLYTIRNGKPSNDGVDAARNRHTQAKISGTT